jgi:hypothetical protein
MAAAFSAIMNSDACKFPLTTEGMTEASRKVNVASVQRIAFRDSEGATTGGCKLLTRMIGSHEGFLEGQVLAARACALSTTS